MKESTGILSYGNYLKIEHNNGYQTLYAHMKKELPVKIGTYVKKGEFIGIMSDSGNAYGTHLHFEVWKDGIRIDSKEYLDKDLTETNIEQKENYNIGDRVKINGVYISSASNDRLTPSITEGTITKIINNAKNPYLLDNGNIGWVNNDVIIEKIQNNQPRYLSNKTYKGFSIVDALKQIGVDSSFTYRKQLASINDIENYTGTSIQNTNMLNLLKQGKLKY